MSYSERIIYRGQSFPQWWEDYLPDEKNPYEKDDTLTLDPGCLKDYWYFHSSNRHPNPKGCESMKLVQGLVLAWFGSAFTSRLPYGVREEEYKNYIRCKYARIGEDKKIQIDDAYNYYEYVIKFIMTVLREVSKNHLPSAIGGYTEKSYFFPYNTDKQRIEDAKREKIRRERTAAETKIASEYIKGDEFFVDTEMFEFEKAEFRAVYFWDDGWGNTTFRLIKEYKDEEVKKNGFDHFYVSSIEQPEISEGCKDRICFTVQVPRLFHGSPRRKDPSKARKILKVRYHFVFVRSSGELYAIKLIITENKVSKELKDKISECCNAAAQEYIRKNLEPEPGRFDSCSGEPYYPYNFFLDNGYCGVEMVYDEMRKFDWDVFC